MTNPKHDGPTLETYVETRFNLLTVDVNKLEAAMEQRFKSESEMQQALIKGYDQRFAHLEQVFHTGQETAKRAVDKAEAAQSAHNVAANEWRGTLNDFKSTLVGRPEFDRFYAEFSAFRLETSRIASISQGEKSGTKDSKESHLALIALAIAILAIIVPFFINK